MKIVILAGGSGTRLWPVSRESFPKQFLKLEGHDSLLQKTIKRFLPCDLENFLIVTNRDILFLVKNQVAEIDPKLVNQIIVEPEKKNTAPAIALALQQLDKEEIVLVCSSDHWIEPKDRFLEAVHLAEKEARLGKLVIFGVQPSKPETGYGYIEMNNGQFVSFTEKPPAALAQKYFLAGNYLWNSGIFAFSVQTFWDEASQHCPALNQQFEEMPEISIDYAIMEKSKNISVIPLHVAWSDIGSWDTVFDVMEKDEAENVKIGNVVTLDTQNSLIMGGKRLIVAVGLEDALVVETADALYLGKRSESQKVRGVVETLKRLGKNETKQHLKVDRPWGHYMVLEEGPRYKVKRIFVAPKQKLSLQMHRHRSEHWVVVKGRALATVGDKEQWICENESTYIPLSTLHRLENREIEPLELIEVQVGEYVGEDDIIRFEDIYGRVEAALAPH